MDLSAALPDDDASGRDHLAAEHLDTGQRLAMPSLFSIVLLGLVLINVHLLALCMLENLNPGRATGEVEVVPIGHERDRQLQRVPNVTRQAIYDQFLVLTGPVLLATGLYYRKHTNAPYSLQDSTGTLRNRPACSNLCRLVYLWKLLLTSGGRFSAFCLGSLRSSLFRFSSV